MHIYRPCFQTISHSHSCSFLKILERESYSERLWKSYSLTSLITKVSILSSFVYHSYSIAISSFAYSLWWSSSPSFVFGEDKFSNNLVNPRPTSSFGEGINPLKDYENNFKSNSRDPRSPLAVISLRNFLQSNSTSSRRALVAPYPLTPILRVGMYHIYGRYP